MIRVGLKLTAAALVAGYALVPASAALANTSAEYFRARLAQTNVPELLNSSEREFYAELFRAIDREDWAKVDTMLADRAMLYSPPDTAAASIVVFKMEHGTMTLSESVDDGGSGFPGSVSCCANVRR